MHIIWMSVDDLTLYKNDLSSIFKGITFKGNTLNFSEPLMGHLTTHS